MSVSWYTYYASFMVGRVPGASSYKDSIAVAIAAVLARRGRQSALVQACCRDLLAVAVGGVQFMKQGRTEKAA